MSEHRRDNERGATVGVDPPCESDSAIVQLMRDTQRELEDVVWSIYFFFHQYRLTWSPLSPESKAYGRDALHDDVLEFFFENRSRDMDARPGTTLIRHVAYLMAHLSQPGYIFAENGAAPAACVAALYLRRKGMTLRGDSGRVPLDVWDMPQQWLETVADAYRSGAPVKATSPGTLDRLANEYVSAIVGAWEPAQPDPDAYRGIQEWIDRRFAADWSFAYRQYGAGSFQQYAGNFVGIFQREVVAVGKSEKTVRELFAATSKGDPDELVLLWVDDHGIR
jgi:hypothetical protein